MVLANNKSNKVMKIRLLVYLQLVFLLGCAGSPMHLSQMDRNQLTTVTDDQLIRAIGSDLTRNNLMFDEVKARKLLSDEEIDLVKSKEIRLGMSEKALLASWGTPTKTNKSVSSFGVRKQFVYGTFSKYSSPTYVYVENGKVTSWQD